MLFCQVENLIYTMAENSEIQAVAISYIVDMDDEGIYSGIGKLRIRLQKGPTDGGAGWRTSDIALSARAT